MNGRRWPWVVSGCCLVLSAVTGAAAVRLWWLPCQGRLLVGTPLGPDFSDSLLGDECIDRMNEGTPFPLPTEAALATPGTLGLATATTLLVAVAWLVPVLAEPISVTRRIAVAMPAFVVGLGAVLGVGIAYGLPGVEAPAYLLATLLPLLVVASLVMVLSQVTARFRYLLAALAVAAMSFFGPVVDYMIMVHWSDANWDAPPGSGYLTAAFLLGCGGAVLIATAVPRRRTPDTPRVVLEEVRS